MKQSNVFLYPLLIIILAIMACNSDRNLNPDTNNTSDMNNTATDSSETDTSGSNLKISIGSKIFNATLASNPTVTAFKSRLPLTVNMTELNGNEKLFNFSTALPANASNPRNIATGDLMLYGSTTLVLFYESFPTSYRYTRIGKIDNPSGLAAALGDGSVSVRFEME